MTYNHKKKGSFFTAILFFTCCWMLTGLSSIAAAASEDGQVAIVGVGTATLPEWLKATAAKGIENQPNAGVQYDLVGLSGDSWHYARVVSYRLEQNLGPAALLFGLAESNPQVLGQLARPLLEKSLAENGGKILEWSQARKMQLGGRNVPGISARLVMTDKVPLPMAAKVYVFMHKERLFALGIFVPDSDRIFWQQISDKIFAKLNWES